MFRAVSIDAFAVVADRTRRRILGELAGGERAVGELTKALELSQPTVSKHLKVLRDNGFVTSRTAAQRRIYRLDHGPLTQLDAWLEPFRHLWDTHLDALERHLETTSAPSPSESSPPAGPPTEESP
jgi:DNA-binding transcriptional ArsR family regulator